MHERQLQRFVRWIGSCGFGVDGDKDYVVVFFLDSALGDVDAAFEG